MGEVNSLKTLLTTVLTNLSTASTYSQFLFSCAFVDFPIDVSKNMFHHYNLYRSSDPVVLCRNISFNLNFDIRHRSHFVPKSVQIARVFTVAKFDMEQNVCNFQNGPNCFYRKLQMSTRK